MKNFSAIALLLLFLAYSCITSCFLHTHVVNGLAIVHSHFHNSKTGDPANGTGHQHTSPEIILIHSLSQYSCDSEPIIYGLSVILPELLTILTAPGTDQMSAVDLHTRFQRGPPSC